MRKRTLARTAERIAQARAKAAASNQPAAESATPAPVSQDAQPPITEANKPEMSPHPPSTAVTSPAHPSLPPKPSTTTVPSATPALPATATATSTPVPAPAQVSAPPVDEQVQKFEENKQRWSWLALRMARDQYLQHFGKIGTGDILLLAQEIEAEKEKEREKKEEKTQKAEENVPNMGSQGGERGVINEVQLEASKIGPSSRQDAEGDVKMEDR